MQPSTICISLRWHFLRLWEAAKKVLSFLNVSAIKALVPPPPSSIMAVGTFFFLTSKISYFFFLNDKHFTPLTPLNVTTILWLPFPQRVKYLRCKTWIMNLSLWKCLGVKECQVLKSNSYSDSYNAVINRQTDRPDKHRSNIYIYVQTHTYIHTYVQALTSHSLSVINNIRSHLLTDIQTDRTNRHIILLLLTFILYYQYN